MFHRLILDTRIGKAASFEREVPGQPFCNMFATHILNMHMYFQGFPKIGGPPSHHPFLDADFPYYKPSSYWGTPMTMETPICHWAAVENNNDRILQGSITDPRGHRNDLLMIVGQIPTFGSFNPIQSPFPALISIFCPFWLLKTSIFNSKIFWMPYPLVFHHVAPSVPWIGSRSCKGPTTLEHTQHTRKRMDMEPWNYGELLAGRFFLFTWFLSNKNSNVCHDLTIMIGQNLGIELNQTIQTNHLSSKYGRNLRIMTSQPRWYKRP